MSLAVAAVVAPVWGQPVQVGTLPDRSTEAVEVLAVDLNGDGLRDVVVGAVNGSIENRVVTAPPVFLINQGGGKFVDDTQQLFGGPAPEIEWDRELLTADFNRDGRADIFIADHGHVNDSDASAGRSGGHQHLFLSTADGRLVDASASLPQQLTFTHSAAVADVNGDGAPDIVENNLGCCSNDRVEAQVLLNDGTGHFTVEPDGIRGMITDIYGTDHSYACALADVNSDGAPDLILGGSENVGANASQVLLNDGHGHFTFFATLPPTRGPANNAFVIDMKAADLNGDGHIDLVLGETLNDPWYIGTNIQVLVNDGTGHFTDETAARLQSPPIQAKSWPQRVLLEDVNDDGRPDLTIQYAPAGTTPSADPTAVYLNDGGVFKPITAPADGFASNGGGIAWVNGDGPHALFSVDSHPLGQGPSYYYVAPQIVVPAAPAVVRATRVGKTVRVHWSASAQAMSYVVLRNRTQIAKVGGTSFVDPKPGRRPSYTVRALNAAGSSPDSTPARP